MRTIYGQPIRQGTTGEFFPHKLSLKEFCNEIRQSIDPYEENMNMFDMKDKELFVEEWFQNFGAWMEIEQETDIK